MRKNNKGFTLTEIVVVVVVIAILVGVSITGIYHYIGKARLNTDITNCKTMKETMAGIEDNPTFYRQLIKETEIDSSVVLYCSIGENPKIDFQGNGSNELKTCINTYMQSIYTDGFSSPKMIGSKFILAIGIKKDANRQVQIKSDCLLVDSENKITYCDDESRVGKTMDTSSIIVW